MTAVRKYLTPTTSSGALTIRADMVAENLALIGSAGPTYSNLLKTISESVAISAEDVALAEAALTRIESRKDESPENWSQTLGASLSRIDD